MNLKTISVIITAYNSEKHIASAIGSVLEQTYPHWELIVVNDGSTDRTLEICRSFAGSRVRIIDQANRGVSEARNAGIRNSQGEYIAFLDADDLWLPEKLERQVDFLDSHPTAGLVFCASRFLQSDGKRTGLKQVSKTKQTTPADVFLLNPIKTASTVMLRRATFEDLRNTARVVSGAANEFAYFDPMLNAAEDLDCWLRIVMETRWQIQGVPDCLVYYRVNPDGLASSLDKYHADWLKVQKRVEASRPAFFRKYAKLAEAFEYRYLTQRGILTGAARGKVLKLSLRMISKDLRVFFKDSFVTFITLAAAWSYLLLPRPIFQRLSRIMQEAVNFLLGM